MSYPLFNLDGVGKACKIRGEKNSGKTTLLYDLLLHERKKHEKLIFFFTDDPPLMFEDDSVKKVVFLPPTENNIGLVSRYQEERLKIYNIKVVQKNKELSREHAIKIHEKYGIIVVFDKAVRISRLHEKIEYLFNNRERLGLTFYLCADNRVPALDWDTLFEFEYFTPYLTTVTSNFSLSDVMCRKSARWNYTAPLRTVEQFITELPLPWQDAHREIIEISLAFSSSDIPVYVLLFIIDFLPDFAAVLEWKKIKSLEGLSKSIISAKEKRVPTKIK